MMRVVVASVLFCACSRASTTEPLGSIDAANTTCSAPQPTCTLPIDPASTACCTPITSCEICWGDSLTTTSCVDGAWSCPAGYGLYSSCQRWWTDGGAPECDRDATTGAPCMRHEDCADGEFCIWQTPGCGPSAQTGICGQRSGLDGCEGCNDYCGCDGVTYQGWADAPFAHHGPCCGSGDAGSCSDG